MYFIFLQKNRRKNSLSVVQAHMHNIQNSSLDNWKSLFYKNFSKWKKYAYNFDLFLISAFSRGGETACIFSYQNLKNKFESLAIQKLQIKLLS